MISRPIQRTMLIKPVWLLLIMSTSVLGSPTAKYDGNNDKTLKPPTAEQINKAMEYGKQFQAGMIPRPSEGPPRVTIPKAYLESQDIFPALPSDGLRSIRPWLYWGYSPCGPYNDFERFVLHVFHFNRQDKDHHNVTNDFDWRCRGLRGSFRLPATLHPNNRHLDKHREKIHVR